MNEKERNQVNNVELFMLAQFIDVLDALNKFEKISDLKEDLKDRRKIYLKYINEMSDTKGFLSLSLYDENIDTKIENCSEIYSESEEYKKILKKFEIEYGNLLKRFEAEDTEKLDKIRGIIYELSSFDVHLAYKIGLIDGIKIKST